MTVSPKARGAEGVDQAPAARGLPPGLRAGLVGLGAGTSLRPGRQLNVAQCRVGYGLSIAACPCTVPVLSLYCPCTVAVFRCLLPRFCCHGSSSRLRAPLGRISFDKGRGL